MKGKIYVIKSYQTDLVYVGSTTQLLDIRLKNHRDNFIRYLNEKFHYITSYEIVIHDDAYIELIEEVECVDENELRKIEGGHIQRLDAINRCVAGRTYAEWREEHREELNEKAKKYYQENKEELKEKGIKYYQKHAEEVKIYKKKYREEHKEEIKEKKKKYYEANKDAKKRRNLRI